VLPVVRGYGRGHGDEARVPCSRPSPFRQYTTGRQEKHQGFVQLIRVDPLVLTLLSLMKLLVFVLCLFAASWTMSDNENGCKYTHHRRLSPWKPLFYTRVSRIETPIEDMPVIHRREQSTAIPRERGLLS